jgi:hypothetical protein
MWNKVEYHLDFVAPAKEPTLKVIEKVIYSEKIFDNFAL